MVIFLIPFEKKEITTFNVDSTHTYFNFVKPLSKYKYNRIKSKEYRQCTFYHNNWPNYSNNLNTIGKRKEQSKKN